MIHLHAPARYVPYVNARYGFSVDRPTFLAPQRPPDDGDGREFRSGAIVMRAYAGWNVVGSNARTLLQDHAKDHRPTLAVAKAGWSALSWWEGGRIHHEKTFVSRTKTTSVEFDYPLSERTRMAPVVTHVVRSLKP